MVPYGSLWFPMVLHGSLWFYMVPYGSTWFSMVFHGFLYGSTIDTIIQGLETKHLLCIKLHTDVTSSLAHDAFAKNGGVVYRVDCIFYTTKYIDVICYDCRIIMLA